MPFKDPEVKRAYDRERARRLRTAWIKENGPCSCGSWEEPQVDHIDPERKLSHRIWSWSAARREAELLKCQVLCVDCHKAKTRTERLAIDRPHGTNGRYLKWNCRCPECKEAHRIANARYR